MPRLYKRTEEIKNGRFNTLRPELIPSFKINQKIAVNKVEIGACNKRFKNAFKGKVIAITDVFIVVQKKSGVKESFSYSDFLTGHVQLG